MKLVIAPIVWLLHFTAVYVLVSLVCAAQPLDTTVFGSAIVPAGVALATLAALVVFGWRGLADYRAWRSVPDETPAFMSIVGLLLCGLSAVAVLWVAIPAFVLPPCAA